MDYSKMRTGIPGFPVRPARAADEMHDVDLAFGDSIAEQLQSHAADSVSTRIASVDGRFSHLNSNAREFSVDEELSGSPSLPFLAHEAWMRDDQNSQKSVDTVDGLPPVSQQDAVRALRKYTTLTNNEIFRRVGVSTSGGYRYLRGEDIKEKETRGRKRKLDEAVVNRVIHHIETQPPGQKTKSWEELAKLAGASDIAPITLKRAIESAGYYKCSHCQRVTKAHGLGNESRDLKKVRDRKDKKSSAS